VPPVKTRASNQRSDLSKQRLAIVSTHPIQYHSPWFRALAARPEIDLDVLYCHRTTSLDQGAGFGVEFNWDVPLLDGYPHSFLRNVAARPGHGGFGGFDTPELSDRIGSGRYDAVLVNGWHYKSAWQAIWASWQTRTPVLVRGDSHLHTPRSRSRQWLKWPAYRWFIPRFDTCLSVGQWSTEYYAHYGAQRGNIVRIPHVIDVSWFQRQAEQLRGQRNDIRRRWGIDEDAVVFMFAGKFSRQKRPMDFVLAVDRAARSGASVVGLMVGDGALRGACEAAALARHAPVRFAGFLNQSEIVAAYVAADYLVLPSDGRETWGLVVNEAMACGLPCIVSDQVGCGPDMIIPGRTGSNFPVGDVGRLAKVLAGYAANHCGLAAMRAAARAMAVNYDLGAAVDGTLRALAASGHAVTA
jgi:glycosyltransferase involved in cell wall biosynthesis